MGALLQIPSLIDVCDQEIYRKHDSNMDFHRILGCTEERFDPQVLLDPLEKEFILPTLFVKEGDDSGEGRNPWLGKQAASCSRHRRIQCT